MCSATFEDILKPDPVKLSKYCLLNVHGFAGLPDELFLEILSHLPTRPLTISPAPRTVLRRESLHSLSAVCQNLRRIFRPFLWQRVEVYSGMRGSSGHEPNRSTMSQGGGPTDFAKELLRQLNIVTIQDPSLAQFVKIVDIEVDGATCHPIFVELARCFPLLPNLHTVKITTESNDNANETVRRAAMRTFKKGNIYPQIRSAILCPSAYPLLAVCPNLESLTALEGDNTRLVKTIKALPALQKLSYPLSLADAREIAGGQSSLQQIIICPTERSSYGDQSFANQLMKTIQLFPNLRILTLVSSNFCPCKICSSTESLKQALLNLEPPIRQNLKEVIFSTNLEGRVCEKFVLS